MSRRIPVLVYGDCPELQACDLDLEINSLSADALRGARKEELPRFDLAVVDADTGNDDALEYLRLLYKTAPSSPTLLLADPDDLDLVEAAIEIGLDDYVLRNAPPQQLEPLVTHSLDNIRRHRHIKERFHESERRFWTFFDQAPIGLLVIDLNGRCEHANAAFTELVGYSVDELRSMSVDTLLADDDRDVWKRTLRELEDGDRDLLRVKQQFIHQSGEPRWTRFSCIAMRDPDGTPAYYLGMVTDRTDRKRIQNNLEHADKMQAMGRLAGGVAHDFNNLLTIVESHCFIMGDNLDNPDKLEWCMDRIRTATERGSKLTRKLLTFGRSQARDTEAVDPNDLIEEMEIVLDSLFGQSVTLKMALDDELRPIDADPDQLEQIITNLALNARDAMPDGGEFTIRTYNTDVDVPSSAVPTDLPRGQYSVLEVSDNGVGMSGDVQQQAFEPFFTTKEVGEGTGLGLSTVYGIVTQNDGLITVDSQQGEGTNFTIYFPSSEQDSETPPKLRRARQGTPTDGTETILLVEDEDQLRLPLEELLASKGYGVISAADAEEALSVSRNHSGPIDLLLTDVIMPGIDGVELADRLTEQRPETSVILMSGYTADALSVQPGDTGQRRRKLLQKPFGVGILSRTIRRMLGGS